MAPHWLGLEGETEPQRLCLWQPPPTPPWRLRGEDQLLVGAARNRTGCVGRGEGSAVCRSGSLAPAPGGEATVSKTLSGGPSNPDTHLGAMEDKGQGGKAPGPGLRGASCRPPPATLAPLPGWPQPQARQLLPGCSHMKTPFSQVSMVQEWPLAAVQTNRPLDRLLPPQSVFLEGLGGHTLCTLVGRPSVTPQWAEHCQRLGEPERAFSSQGGGVSQAEHECLVLVGPGERLGGARDAEGLLGGQVGGGRGKGMGTESRTRPPGWCRVLFPAGPGLDP